MKDQREQVKEFSTARLAMKCVRTGIGENVESMDGEAMFNAWAPVIVGEISRSLSQRKDIR